jgi:hypothetical protein
MNISSSLNSGSVPATYHNDGAYQEYVYQVSGANAEFSSGGVTINMIPKEGSNTIRSDGVALYTNGNFQAQNVDDAQRAQGVTAPAKIDKTWDYNFSGGFPIMKDRLWWFTSARFWGYNNFAPNAIDKDGNQVVDDKRRPRLDQSRHRAAEREEQDHGDVRLPAQVPRAPRHRTWHSGA